MRRNSSASSEDRVWLHAAAGLRALATSLLSARGLRWSGVWPPRNASRTICVLSET